MRLSALLTLFVLAFSFAFADAAHAAANLDSFDSFTLNPLRPDGHEEPYTRSTIVETPQVDTSAYTTQAGETDDFQNRSGCPTGDGKTSWVGKTAWTRFVVGVDGTLAVHAAAPYFDPVLFVWEAPVAEPGATRWGDLARLGCADASRGPSEDVTVHVKAGTVLELQLGGICARQPPPSSTACPDPQQAQGGLARFHVEFTADDRDGDGIPDTLDRCPDAGGTVDGTGCPPTPPGTGGQSAPPPPPDADGDGVADDLDNCPGQPGVSADSPRNGCPAARETDDLQALSCGGGPPPNPPPWPSVSINNGDLGTMDRRVMLRFFNAPPGTTDIYVSNDGGDLGNRIAPSPCASWLLPDFGAQRTPATIWVVFGGPYGFTWPATDTVVLDNRPPTLDVGTPKPIASDPNDVTLSVEATDDESGVERIEVQDEQGHMLQRFKNRCTDTKCGRKLAQKIQLPRVGRAAQIAAYDAAHNETSQPLAMTSCKRGERRVVLRNKFTCRAPGESCRARDAKAYAAAKLRCVRGKLRRR